MDAFLRRVVELREREQEADLLRTSAADLVLECADCGKTLRINSERLCGACMKRAKRRGLV